MYWVNGLPTSVEDLFSLKSIAWFVVILFTIVSGIASIHALRAPKPVTQNQLASALSPIATLDGQKEIKKQLRREGQRITDTVVSANEKATDRYSNRISQLEDGISNQFTGLSRKLEQHSGILRSSRDVGELVRAGVSLGFGLGRLELIVGFETDDAQSASRDIQNQISEICSSFKMKKPPRISKHEEYTRYCDDILRHASLREPVIYASALAGICGQRIGISRAAGERGAAFRELARSAIGDIPTQVIPVPQAIFDKIMQSPQITIEGISIVVQQQILVKRP